MKRRFGAFVILLGLYIYLISAEIRQDHAEITVCNQKYVTNCSMFTGRTTRRGPYLTNMSAVLLQPWGNNVSIIIRFDFKTGASFGLKYKLCDALTKEWLLQFYKSFSNLDTPVSCPIPDKAYLFRNMELPPKNLPLPASQGDYIITLELVLTTTLERLAAGHVSIHLDDKKHRRRKNK